MHETDQQSSHGPQGLIAAVDRLNRRIGSAIAWCALAMVLAQAIVVLLRYVFTIGSIPLQESIWYLHGLIFMLGAGYTLMLDGHVRIDIFYSRASIKTRALIDTFGLVLFLLPVCVAVIFTSLPYVAASWRILEGSSEASGLPLVFLLKSVIPLAFALLTLQGVALLIRTVAILLAAPSHSPPETY